MFIKVATNQPFGFVTLQVLNEQTFAIMVLMALFTTFITTPILMAVYKPARKGVPYKHRTVQRKELDTEFRNSSMLP